MALINTTTTGILGTTVYGDGAGALTIQQDGVTINKVTANPTFAVYLSASQTISSDTATKIQFNVEQFDTNNCYDTVNYRFLPNVAGYYQINLSVSPYGSGEPSRVQTMIYKNGSVYVRLHDIQIATSGSWINDITGSDLVYLNGTTDYVEGYALIIPKSGTPQMEGSTYLRTSMSGFLARAA